MGKCFQFVCLAAAVAALGRCAAHNQAAATPATTGSEAARLCASTAPAPALTPAVKLVRSEAKTSKAKKPVAKVGAHAKPKTAAKAALAAKRLPKPLSKAAMASSERAERLVRNVLPAGAKPQLMMDNPPHVEYSIEPNCGQMVQLVTEGRLQEATALCDSTLQGCPEMRPFLDENLAFCLAMRVTDLTDQTRTADARAVVNWALERFPGNPELQCRLAELELRQGNDQAALRIFQDLNWDAMTTNHRQFWRGCSGLVFARTGRLAESRALIPAWGFEAGATRDPSEVAAMPDTTTLDGLKAYWLLMLSIHRSNLSSQEGGNRAFLDGAFAFAPSSPQVMYSRAQACWSQGDTSGALALLQQAVHGTTGAFHDLLRDELFRWSQDLPDQP